MVGREGFLAGEVRDRAGDLEDPVIGTGGEVKLLDRTLQQVAHRGVDRAVAPDLGMAHARVVGRLGAGKPLQLPGARGGDSSGHGRRAFAGLFGTQFGQGQGRRLDVEIEPVEQRAAEPGAVTLDLGRGAAAFAPAVAEITAGALVCCQSVRSRSPAGDRSRLGTLSTLRP